MTDETESKDLIVVEPSAPNAVSVHVDLAADIRRRLGRKTPAKYIKKRKGPWDSRTGTNKMLAYIPWGYTARVLNDTFGPAWSLEYDMVQDVKRIPLPDLPAKPAKGRDPGRDAVKREEVMVTITLKTPFGNHTATASHTYFPDNDMILLGDVVQSAVSKALKRAGARIGIGLDLYLDDDGEDFANADAANAEFNLFREACAGLGLTPLAAITLLSTEIAGDPEALTGLGDCVEALGSLQEVVTLLKDTAARITAQVPTAIEPDEIVVAKDANNAKGKKA